MENVIGWLLVVMLVAVPALLVYGVVKLYSKHRKAVAEADRRREEALAQLKKSREETWNRMSKGATHVGKTQYDYIADQKRTTVTEKATGRQMSYVHQNDDGPDLLTTMIVADMLLNHKDSSSGTVSWKNDVPSVSTSSYSSDDDRKSSSWSSSPSYSDSGPSYSSSSDSSPSSDW